MSARAADDWWHTLPDDRRIQIWRWVQGPHHTTPETPGQLSIPIRPRRHR